MTVSENEMGPCWANGTASIYLPFTSLKCDLNHDDFLDLCACLTFPVTEAEQSIYLWPVLV